MEKIDGSDSFRALGHSADGELRSFVAGVFGQLMSALDYIHGLNIIHGELSPSNLLVDANGLLKLIDFEHSRRLDIDESDCWPYGTSVGTPLYVSPEHLSGRLVIESDHFVVGLLIFEFLTGRSPLQAERMELVFNNLLHMNPDWTGCAARFIPLLQSLLSIEPSHRAPGWAMLRNEIALGGVTVPAAGASESGPRCGDVALSDTETPPRFSYDVAISFTGEQREQARAIADCLRRGGVKVFFDEYEQANLWGEDLYQHLGEIYQKQARYCLMLVSQAYADKVWTSHERKNAQARALNEKRGYILPVRFDDTDVPGMIPTIAYLSYEQHGSEGVCRLIRQKLERSRRSRSDLP